MKQITKVFKTKNNEILLVTAKTEGCGGRPYVSVTASMVEPILRSEAVDSCRESLEDGELWRQAVEAEQTEQGLQDWIDSVLTIDGELSLFDNSLYPNEIKIDGEYWLFRSASCGCLHDTIKEVTNRFNRLIALHLKDSKAAITEAEKIISGMTKDAVDPLVEKYTRQIIGITT